MNTRESTADTLRSVMKEFGGGDLASLPDMVPPPSAEVPEGSGDGSVPESGTYLEGQDPPVQRDRVGRDPVTGKFKSLRDQGEPGDASEASGDNGEVTPQPADQAGSEMSSEAGDSVPEAPELEPLDPPPSWSLEDQNAFRKLTPEAQRFTMARLEAETAPIAELRSQAERYQSLDQLLEPQRQVWAAYGIDETTALKQLFALNNMANSQPAEFVRFFMSQRGLRPENIFGPAQPAPTAQNDGQPDPRHQMQVDPRLQQLEGRLSQAEKALTQRLQAEERAHREQYSSEINEFREAKDDKGRASHPYFDEVRPLMATFFEQGHASDLKTAYDMACRAHPAVREKIAAAEEHRRQQEALAEQRKKAAAAAKAGKSVSGDSSGITTAQPEPVTDIRESMRREFARRGYSV